MSIPTVNVLVSVNEQDGSPAVGAQVIAKLMTIERYNGFVVPDEYSGVTDNDGNCTISLFPNELGTEGSEYKFKIIHRNGKTVNVFASIPNYDCSLHQVSELDRYELRGAGQILTLEVAQYANEAIMARDAAQLSEINASGYANQASTQAGVATGQASIASTKATEASASASAALSSANNAATSEANAATSASNANTAKIAAESARDLANSYKTAAQSAEAKAKLWADQTVDVTVETGKYSALHHATKAAASATSASTSKDTATTKAAEASASATAAANSATTAAGSATTAGTHATNAQSSANAAAASAGNASASASTANTKATEAATSALNAANSASAAATSKSGADAAMASTVTYRDEAQAATLKAKAWADNNENVYVEGSSYSAKHHAIKAAASASLASTHKDAAAGSATSASNSATNAANSATTATTKANQAAASATAAANSATDAQLAAASIGVMSESGVLNVGQDTITLTWAYDTALGNVAVYLSGVKQEKASLTFVDQYHIKVAEPVSELTTWEVTTVTMSGESVLTTLRNEADAARDEVVAIRQVMPGKNKIINGNFDIWQRGAVFTSGGLTADRWGLGVANVSTEVLRVDNGMDVTGESDGRFSLRATVTNPVSATSSISYIEQKIESVCTLSNRKATVSFWAKANEPKYISVTLSQDFGTGGSPSSGVWCPAQKVLISTAWTRYKVTFDVPSIAGKVFGTDNNHHLRLMFWLCAGTNYNIQNGSLGLQSGVFDIAQVQVEEGEIATAFEARHIADELALCQRYYESSTLYSWMQKITYTSLNPIQWAYKVKKRASPSVLITSQPLNAASVTFNSLQAQSTYGCAICFNANTLEGGMQIFVSADSEL